MTGPVTGRVQLLAGATGAPKPGSSCSLAARCASLHPDWRAVWQFSPTWRTLKRVAAVCALYAAAAALQRACDVRWDAPGAPAKEPLLSWAADALLQLATAAAAVQLTERPAFLVALLGPLAPRELHGQAQHGFRLLRAMIGLAVKEWQSEQLAEGVGALFVQRPQALAALHAALA